MIGKGLDEFTEYLEDLHVLNEKNGDFLKSRQTFDILLKWYEVLKKARKFNMQARRAKEAMKRLNPGFCEGYFPRG